MIYIEDTLPDIRQDGLNTLKTVDFSGSTAVALPTATTIAGVAIASLASVTSSATTGAVFSVTDTGIYTGVGVDQVVANSLTSGVATLISITGATTGIGQTVKATAATLTTGRYYSANDAAGEVFGIGANGHIHSTVGATPPTIAVTTQAGITAAAITAGGSDTCGVITTTGTSTGATILTVTFNKTYTTAPKTVSLTPANAAAAMPNTGYFISSITATTFVITVAAGGTYAATPSWYYQVIA